MFNLFGGSDQKFKVLDRVWMSKKAKWNACTSMVQVNPACIFIAWFEQTGQELIDVLENDQQIILAEKIDYNKLQDKMVVFAEHYPLPQKERAIFKTLNLTEILVTSSLDEPLFMHLGGDRTIEIIKKLGMKEDEVLGHSFITSAIRNAQQKLEKKVKIEKLANSVEEWFALNVG